MNNQNNENNYDQRFNFPLCVILDDDEPPNIFNFNQNSSSIINNQNNNPSNNIFGNLINNQDENIDESGIIEESSVNENRQISMPNFFRPNNHLQKNNILVNNPFINNKNTGNNPFINSGNPFKIIEFKDKNKNNNLINIGNENKFFCYFQEKNLTNENDINIKNEKIKNDLENIKKLNEKYFEEMKCAVCFSQIKDPISCKYCNNFFCRKCIEQWFEKNNKFGDFQKCLMCKEKVYLKDFKKINLVNRIMPLYDNLKENNEKYFNEKINYNLSNHFVICANKIHDQKKDDEKYQYINIINEKKACCFCLTCNQPYCFSCISNNIKENGHNNSHLTVSIDVLKDAKFFDLLYEKCKFHENIVKNLEKINADISGHISELKNKSKNMILFIENLKNMYIKKIEKNIEILKEFSKKNEEEINNTKNKIGEIDNFIKGLKKLDDVTNVNNLKLIKAYLDIFETMKLSSKEAKEKMNNLKNNFTGFLVIKENINAKININDKEFLNKDVKIYYKNNLKNNNVNKINLVKDEKELKIEINDTTANSQPNEYQEEYFVLNTINNDYRILEQKNISEENNKFYQENQNLQFGGDELKKGVCLVKNNSTFETSINMNDLKKNKKTAELKVKILHILIS